MTEDDFGYATTNSAMADHEQLERTHESPSRGLGTDSTA